MFSVWCECFVCIYFCLPHLSCTLLCVSVCCFASYSETGAKIVWYYPCFVLLLAISTGKVLRFISFLCEAAAENKQLFKIFCILGKIISKRYKNCKSRLAIVLLSRMSEDREQFSCHIYYYFTFLVFSCDFFHSLSLSFSLLAFFTVNCIYLYFLLPKSKRFSFCVHIFDKYVLELVSLIDSIYQQNTFKIRQ